MVGHPAQRTPCPEEPGDFWRLGHGHFRDELKSRDPLLQLSGVVDAPAKLHSQLGYRGTELRQPQAQPTMGVKRHLAALKMIGESLEQVFHLLVRQVHQEPLGNDHRRLVAAYLVQKGGI
jgi:hypothetical protein